MRMTSADFSLKVRLRIYEKFIASGRCPSKSELAADFARPLPEINIALQELAAAHMLVLQPDSGEVLMASPLSAVPTAFAVETTRQLPSRNFYGNCIWDALGVLAMLHSDGRVLTSCGCCGESITVTVRDGQVTSEPGGIVHFALPARQWWDDIVFT